MAQVVSLDKARQAKAEQTVRAPKAQDFGLKSAKGQKSRADICFDRSEFGKLMSMYSQQVALGTWRDYALDTAPGIAVFSIFRQTAEQPLYTVCKLVHPSGRGRQYAVFQGPKRLKLAESLEDALTAFDGRLSSWIGSEQGQSS